MPEDNLEYERVGIPDYHVKIKIPREEGQGYIEESLGSKNFNEIKDFIEEKLREFQHSTLSDKIIIDLERIK